MESELVLYNRRPTLTSPCFSPRGNANGINLRGKPRRKSLDTSNSSSTAKGSKPNWGFSLQRLLKRRFLVWNEGDLKMEPFGIGIYLRPQRKNGVLFSQETAGRPTGADNVREIRPRDNQFDDPPGIRGNFALIETERQPIL